MIIGKQHATVNSQRGERLQVDMQTGKKVLTLHGIHKDGITSVCFSPDGKCIVTGAGSAAKTLSLHYLPVRYVRDVPHGGMCAPDSVRAVCASFGFEVL